MSKLQSLVNKISKEVSEKENNRVNLEEMTKMTKTELKEMAKELGIKGYYKMKKAELEEAIRNTKLVMAQLKTEEENKENVLKAAEALSIHGANTVDSKVLENVVEQKMEQIKDNKGQAKTKGLNRLSIKGILKMVNNNNTKEEIDKAITKLADKARRKSNFAFKVAKKDSKNIKVINSFRIEFGYNGKEELYQNTYVQPGQESELFRFCKVESGVIADKTMVLKGEYINEVISIGFKKDILEKIDGALQAFQDVFNSLLSSDKRFITEGANEFQSINLIFNTTSGVVRFTEDKMEELKDDEYLMTYEFLGITPSGLRSASFLAAAIERRDNENGLVKIDRRKELLDEAMHGAFALNFLDENGNFKEAKSKLALFKDATRMTQCAPGSKRTMDVDNYMVVTNIAEKAMFNGRPAKDINDGNILASAKAFYEGYVVPNGLALTLEDVIGLCQQDRGTVLKCSATFTEQNALSRYAIKSIKDGIVSWIIVKGTKMTLNEFRNLPREERVSFFENIQLIADKNAMKLPNFRPVFNLLELKQAYLSKSKLNSVVVMAMMYADPVATKEFLLRRGKEAIKDHFKNLGVEFDINDKGNIVPKPLNLKNVKFKNSNSQMLNYLFNCDPEKALAIAPGIFRSLMMNSITGLSNLINELKIDIDSEYTVVQSDRGCLYDAQILAEDEIYCPNFDLVEKVSAVRHPISSFLAVTNFKFVTLEEILKRILNLKVSDEVKEDIASFYTNVKGYAVLPGSQFLMQKHDGMDWDIDAMQIILDKEVTAILSKLPNIGSIIPDSDDWQRETILNAENNISDEKFIKPAIELSKPKESNEEENDTASAFGMAIKKTVLTYSFDDICLVARDYFLNDIANVGEIATAFYNNADILFSLNSGELSISEVNKIVEKFRKHYKCQGKTPYVSEIDLDNKTYTINKIKACDIIFKFAQSSGTIEDIKAFLFDCCLYNRYIAETSIDSAKKMYFIMNMYNHAKLVRGLGSDKNMTIGTTDLKDEEQSKFVNELFIETIDKFGISKYCTTTGNNFNLNLICVTKQKGFDINKIGDAELAAKKDFLENKRKRMRPVPLAINSPIASIKKELMTFANDLIVLSTKLVENYIMSDEAKKIREAIKSEFADTLGTNKKVKEDRKQVKIAYRCATNAYRTVTECVEKAEEFEGKAMKLYLNEVATQATRNGAILSTYGISSYDMGMYAAIQLGRADGAEAINPAIFKVFGKELVEYLSTKMDNVGTVAERIDYAILDGKKVDLKLLVGEEVSIEHGNGLLGETEIFVQNKKANIEGYIAEEDGHYYVISELKFADEDHSKGAYIANNSKAIDLGLVGETNCKNAFIPTRYEIKDKVKRGSNTFYNVVYAYNEEDEYRIEGALTASNDLIEVIKELKELTPANFKTFVAENGHRCFFLIGDIVKSILESLAITEEDFESLQTPDVDFDAPEGEESVEDAIENNEYYTIDDFAALTNEDGGFTIPDLA